MVRSEEGKPMGTYDTKDQAKHGLQLIEMFKSMKEHHVKLKNKSK